MKDIKKAKKKPQKESSNLTIKLSISFEEAIKIAATTPLKTKPVPLDKK